MATQSQNGPVNFPAVAGKANTSITAELSQKIGAQACATIDKLFGDYLLNRNETRDIGAEQQRVIEALVRASLSGTQPSEVQRIEFLLPEKIENMKKARDLATSRHRLPQPSAKALTLRPLGGMTFNDGIQVAEDTKLQIFAAPYVATWTSHTPEGNAESSANANAQNGSFGFFIGAAGGSATAGAGVWVQFIPDPPLPRLVQVRPYVPYDYQWDDRSDNGYTAHNDGGFGVYVLSWDMQGADQRLEQDFRYGIWSDGTGWWEHHHNPSEPNPDYGNAFLYGNEAPYFEAQEDRIYQACIWCFGSCDSGSGFFGNSLTASDINAEVGFVVIGEQ